jgi:NADPH-dependent ferric siderophore reductase
MLPSSSSSQTNERPTSKERPAPREGIVTAVTDITPHLRQIRIADPSLKGFTWIPGQHVGVRLPPDILRVYSVRYCDNQEGFIDLWIINKELGPGSQWARHVRVNDHVEFGGPRGSFVLAPEPAPYYLFAGEETAAIPIQAMLQALPVQATVLGYLQADRPGTEIPYNGPHALPWVYRNASSASPSPTLIEAIQSLKLPETPGMAYLAGEALTCQAIRHYLIEEKQWPATAIRTKPFWTPGKTGLH